MYSEISKQAFKQLVNSSDKVDRVEELELARKIYFNVFDVTVVQIENFISCVTQYYIQDINA